ncbi:hypothetical protein [Aureliella helgolandensis]|uniref:Peptidase family protein n=1 Tax=Aureliella helgolandensis TaxID=2527968 RepID=A0A518GGQ6_9BACT|nr:hypothetical protein [Aureliella helgolandensis]QDV27782.1 Putative peptidase family protein [Aureliella helgolandensis]
MSFQNIARATLLPIFICLASACGSAEEAESLFPAGWQKSSTQDPSCFVNISPGKWLEVFPSGNSLSFEETSRAGRVVELFDPGRQIKIKLKPDGSEIAVGDADFSPWVQGLWKPSKELPEYAEFAPVDYRLRLLYFVPTDRQPIENYTAKIRCVMKLVHSFYQVEFARRGWSKQSLLFELDDSQQPIVHLIRGQHAAAYYSGAPNYDVNQQYGRLIPEIPKEIGHPSTQLIVAFMETYDSGPHHFEWPGGVALGGQWSPDGGLGIFSAWILQDQFCATTMEAQLKLFQDETPIVGRTALGHGRPDSPRFEFIEDGFGAVIHEVGHSLGLPHDRREDHYYIMGNGFRRLRANLDQATPLERRARFSDANAGLLSVSRHLNPMSDRSDNQAPTGTLSLDTTETANVYRLLIDAQDDRGLAAVAVMLGGNVIDGASLNGQTISQPFEVNLETSDSATEIEVLVADQGGNIAKLRLQD